MYIIYIKLLEVRNIISFNYFKSEKDEIDPDVNYDTLSFNIFSEKIMLFLPFYIPLPL